MIFPPLVEFKVMRLGYEHPDTFGNPHLLGYYLNEKPLDPGPSQKIRNHSPDGFYHGYAGSGASQLALAICLELFGENVAPLLYQKFKDRFIVPFPQPNSRENGGGFGLTNTLGQAMFLDLAEYMREARDNQPLEVWYLKPGQEPQEIDPLDGDNERWADELSVNGTGDTAQQAAAWMVGTHADRIDYVDDEEGNFVLYRLQDEPEDERNREAEIFLNKRRYTGYTQHHGITSELRGSFVLVCHELLPIEQAYLDRMSNAKK